jgi:hypothetical protein
MIPSEQSTFERAATLVKRSYDQVTAEERKAILNELIELYEVIVQQEELARQVRQSFLLALMNEPEVLTEATFSSFLAEYFKPEDLDGLQWQEPSQVISLCETLYGFQFPSEAQAEQVKAHVGNLLRHALQQFEQQGDFEKMFRLLHLTPTSSLIEEAELFRLHNRAYLYEMRRMQRNRHFLYGYLILYIILVILVFPFLFINAENGAIQDQIEHAAEVDIPEEKRQFFSYIDGLYWSLITASSIGYGDIAPVTQVGRGIAATLGVMGVITIGVVAGLILELITPRRLD